MATVLVQTGNWDSASLRTIHSPLWIYWDLHSNLEPIYCIHPLNGLINALFLLKRSTRSVCGEQAVPAGLNCDWNTWRTVFRMPSLDRWNRLYPRLHISLHCARSVSISSTKPSPEISNRPCGSQHLPLFAQTASAPTNRECVSAAVRCAQAGERWQVPRGTGQTNMDLRKTLISLLWILLLNHLEDCHTEEGMWKHMVFFFLPLIGCSQTGSRSWQRRSTDRMSAADSLVFALVLSWNQVHALQLIKALIQVKFIYFVLPNCTFKTPKIFEWKWRESFGGNVTSMRLSARYIQRISSEWPQTCEQTRVSIVT